MIRFNKEQNDFIKSLGIQSNELVYSDDDLVKVEDKVSEKLQINGFDKNYNINEVGIMCESILDKLND